MGQRLLLLGLGILAFSLGCRNTCQSHLDYTGPLPAEPSDFLYRRNSILGGDPSKPPLTTGPIEPAPEEDVPPGLVGEDLGEEAPADPGPTPGIDDLDLGAPGEGEETMPDAMPPADADDDQASDVMPDEPAEAEPQAQLEWHAPRPR
ncbi:MAG TPA: hypothetical protein VF306_22625 [Pirellulales bacterium]